eukprot:3743669-Prymnesium_polylepis.1
MGSRLLGALGASSVVALSVLGCLWHTLGLLLVPLAVVLLHAAVRRPPTSGDTLELAVELRQRVVRALRGEHAESDELEAGGPGDSPPPVRDAEMAKRVEQIRNKYRCAPRHGAPRTLPASRCGRRCGGAVRRTAPAERTGRRSRSHGRAFWVFDLSRVCAAGLRQSATSTRGVGRPLACGTAVTCALGCAKMVVM